MPNRIKCFFEVYETSIKFPTGCVLCVFIYKSAKCKQVVSCSMTLTETNLIFMNNPFGIYISEKAAIEDHCEKLSETT